MQTIANLGADVDSRSIVIACAAHSFAPIRIANERRAIVTWLRSIAPGTRLGVEATSLRPHAPRIYQLSKTIESLDDTNREVSFRGTRNRCCPEKQIPPLRSG